MNMRMVVGIPNCTVIYEDSAHTDGRTDDRVDIRTDAHPVNIMSLRDLSRQEVKQNQHPSSTERTGYRHVRKIA